MLIWTLAIVLVLIFVGLGFLKGGIRMSVWLLGLILATMLAVPMSGSIKGLMPTLGIKNPVWAELMAPVFIFILINLVAIGLSFLAHHKVAKHFKFTRDDADRIRWERLNRRLGASMGVIFATVFFFLIGAVVYAGGYLTLQASPDENNPASVRFLNGGRKGLNETGMAPAMAAISPATPKFYKAADILGLLYHNASLQTRLANYPGLLGLGQRTEFQEMSEDKEYNEMIFGKAPPTQILDHARTQAILGNKEIMDQLMAVDMDDLKGYLRTGKSAKYDENLILGRWTLEKDAIFTQMRKANPDIRAGDLIKLRKVMDMLPPIQMLAMPDNKVLAKIAGAPAPEGEAAPAEPVVDPMVERYRNPNAPAPGAVPPPAGASGQGLPAGMQIPNLNGEGTWSEDFTGSYKITFTMPDGKETTMQATVKDDEMILNAPGIPLVFYKE
ncbi:MAG: hypothetical protein ACO1QB_18975 [Verrucomicrobiales bacterium]